MSGGDHATMALPMMQAIAVLGVVALVGFALQAIWFLVVVPVLKRIIGD